MPTTSSNHKPCTSELVINVVELKVDMPTLKQLTCTVEWTGSNVPLQEFQPTYGDGYVHTFIAVPPIQTPFSVHLTSHGYIARKAFQAHIQGLG